MREIKFRAFHTRNKKMYAWDDIIKKYPNTALIEFVNSRHLIPMEYIGLCDKNGNEIYEGDIVKVNHPDDHSGDFKNTVGVVLYSVSEAAFVHSGHNGRPPKRMWEYCKVIGNIYENPELLEDK